MDKKGKKKVVEDLHKKEDPASGDPFANFGYLASGRYKVKLENEAVSDDSPRVYLDPGIYQVSSNEFRKRKVDDYSPCYDDDKQFQDKQFDDKELNDKQLDDKQLIDKQINDKQFNDKQLDDKQFNNKQLDDKQLDDKQFADKKVDDKKLDDKQSDDNQPVPSRSKAEIKAASDDTPKVYFDPGKNPVAFSSLNDPRKRKMDEYTPRSVADKLFDNRKCDKVDKTPIPSTSRESPRKIDAAGKDSPRMYLKPGVYEQSSSSLGISRKRKIDDDEKLFDESQFYDDQFDDNQFDDNQFDDDQVDMEAVPSTSQGLSSGIDPSSLACILKYTSLNDSDESE